MWLGAVPVKDVRAWTSTFSMYGLVTMGDTGEPIEAFSGLEVGGVLPEVQHGAELGRC